MRPSLFSAISFGFEVTFQPNQPAKQQTWKVLVTFPSVEMHKDGKMISLIGSAVCLKLFYKVLSSVWQSGRCWKIPLVLQLWVSENKTRTFSSRQLLGTIYGFNFAGSQSVQALKKILNTTTPFHVTPHLHLTFCKYYHSPSFKRGAAKSFHWNGCTSYFPRGVV